MLTVCPALRGRGGFDYDQPTACRETGSYEAAKRLRRYALVPHGINHRSGFYFPTSLESNASARPVSTGFLRCSPANKPKPGSVFDFPMYPETVVTGDSKQTSRKTGLVT